MAQFNLKKSLLRLGAACLAGLLPLAHVHAQGAGKAIDFPGTTALEHINLGDSLSNRLDTVSFTIEMWINFDNASNGDPAFIGNKDWNSGANTGFAWALKDASHIRFNFKPSGGTRRDYDMTVNRLQGQWNHIAIVADRKGYLTGYVNGIQNGTAVSIIADSARTLDGTLPVRLGSDGTGTYNYNGVSRFDGKIDEVRIWKAVRTQAQIRDNMCHKLTGNETGLLAYYPMNELTGTTINNNAAAYSTVFGGIFQNSPVRIQSSAPLGDTAVNLYVTPFGTQTLSLASNAHGTLTAQNIGGTLKGIHIYRVDAAPNTYTNIPNANANSVYYGIFPADSALAGTYGLQYDYTAFPAANTYEQGIDIYKRTNADSAWTVSYATKNTTANTLALSGISTIQEMIIGNFANPATCNIPTALNVQNITTSSAVLGWTSGGSNHWNIEYGVGNFTQGTGTRVNNLAAASYNVTGLQQNIAYRFYVQDSCASLNGSSAWAGPFSFTTLKDYSTYGSGYAMSFPGTSANEHVNLGTAMSAATDTSNFSVEMWINFDKFNDDEAFVSNKNWNNGANIGWAWTHSDKSGFPANTLWFNMQPTGGVRRDWHITLPGLNLINHWNHVAVTVDRKGDIAFYINGVPATIVAYAQGGTNSFTTVSMNIAADSNKSMKGTLPVRLGQDGTGTYGVKFKGKIDEVRFWNRVRTQTEIRDYMCRKLKPTDTSLIAYYRMDETTGTTANNIATTTNGLFGGVLTNNPVRVVSGAPIGDTSAYIYGAATTLQLASAQNGKVIADSLNGLYAGMQLYRVDTIPNTTFDIANVGANKTYFGAFPVDTAGSSSNFVTTYSTYRLTYDYSGYPAAVSANTNLHLYNRPAADVMMWTDLGANNQTAGNKMIAAMQHTRKELILADFTPATCADITNLHTDSISNTSARIAWSSNASAWNVQYGPQGFVLGQGTIDTVTSTHDNIDSLQADNWYDVYIRSRCSGNDSSKWVGPYTIHTSDPCPAPANLQVQYLGGDSVLITWANTGASNWTLQWGQQGFVFGNGIPVDGIATNSYVLTGLSNTGSFDVYLQDSCTGSGKSKWLGPVTFQANGSTPPPASVNNVAAGHGFNVYPNPARTYIQVDAVNGSSLLKATFTNLQGQVVRTAELGKDGGRIMTNDLPEGIYMLQCSNRNGTHTFKVLIQQ
ncbi:LamG-like jellyroll fold domain-containing protein [Chitinophagaceae bacterium MMS25-I14]